ncbi:hypothetical protein D3C76_1402190 [compost metagenome]
MRARLSFFASGSTRTASTPDSLRVSKAALSQLSIEPRAVISGLFDVMFIGALFRIHGGLTSSMYTTVELIDTCVHGD